MQKSSDLVYSLSEIRSKARSGDWWSGRGPFEREAAVRHFTQVSSEQCIESVGSIGPGWGGGAVVVVDCRLKMKPVGIGVHFSPDTLGCLDASLQKVQSRMWPGVGFCEVSAREVCWTWHKQEIIFSWVEQLRVWGLLVTAESITYCNWHSWVLRGSLCGY